MSNREILYESRLEWCFFMILLASGHYRELLEQQRVEYFDEDGVGHYHWFDVVAVEHGGRRVAVDVKPLEFVESSGIERIQCLIREQHGQSFASAYVVRTEMHTHPTDVADALTVLHVRGQPDAVADAAMAHLARSLYGWTCVGDLVAASGMGAAAYNAIVRLIQAGTLFVYQGARISYSAYVSRLPEAAIAA